MTKEYKHPVMTDNKMSSIQLADELTEYIGQFITDPSDELIDMIRKDSYNFVLICLFNFRQR